MMRLPLIPVKRTCVTSRVGRARRERDCQTTSSCANTHRNMYKVLLFQDSCAKRPTHPAAAEALLLGDFGQWHSYPAVQA